MNIINPPYNCVICVAGKDNVFVHKVIKLVLKQFSIANIYIITKPQYFIYYKSLKKLPLNLIDENKLVDSLTFNGLREQIKNRKGKPLSTGWYFQQFLKMGFALTDYAKEYYLVWDSDTLPVSKFHLFENGKPLFIKKTEYHAPYFITMNKLLGLTKSVAFSFISENMIVKTSLMRELISKISSSPVPGEYWFNKIINAIPADEVYAFSEYETYGTFVTNYYPDLYGTRELRTYREAGRVYSRLITKSGINKLSSRYDIVSFELGHLPPNPQKFIQRILRALLHLTNFLLDYLYFV